MSNKRHSQLYRNFTKKILNKIVTPQVLGSTAELEHRIAQSSEKTQFCYVLQDASLSNTVLIDQQTQSRFTFCVCAFKHCRASGRRFHFGLA